ncbi:unnamed protein product [Merluccius merluccius]
MRSLHRRFRLQIPQSAHRAGHTPLALHALWMKQLAVVLRDGNKASVAPDCSFHRIVRRRLAVPGQGHRLPTLDPADHQDYSRGTDFTSREGYDALILRLKDGKQMCKDVEELFKMRALAEERYGKELMMISQKARGLTEIGTLRASFNHLKSHIEDIGLSHIHLADALREEVRKIEIFQEKQKEQRKKSKKHCKQRCQEASEVERNAQKTAATSASPKTIEKVFQQLESDRISFLRCALWDHCNHFSMQCVKDDEVRLSSGACFLVLHRLDLNSQFTVYEDVRTILEKCDIRTDNNCFIQMKSTSTKQPEPMIFKSYCVLRESTQGSLSNLSTLGSAAVSERLSIIQGTSLGSNVTLDDNTPCSTRTSSGNSLDDVDASGCQHTSASALVAMADHTYRVVYGYIAQVRPDPSMAGWRYVTLYVFAFQNEDELSLRKGEEVQLIEQGEDGWWTVERGGEVGLVPGNYLAMI